MLKGNSLTAPLTKDGFGLSENVSGGKNTLRSLDATSWASLSI